MSRKITLIVQERDYNPVPHGAPMIVKHHLIDIECPALEMLVSDAKESSMIEVVVVGAEIKEQTNDE